MNGTERHIAAARRTALTTINRNRLGRIERRLTDDELARIQRLWSSDSRPSRVEIARLTGLSEYAVRQALAKKNVAIYTRAGRDPIQHARDHCPVGLRIREIMRMPR